MVKWIKATIKTYAKMDEMNKLCVNMGVIGILYCIVGSLATLLGDNFLFLVAIAMGVYFIYTCCKILWVLTKEEREKLIKKIKDNMEG